MSEWISCTDLSDVFKLGTFVQLINAYLLQAFNSDDHFKGLLMSSSDL